MRTTNYNKITLLLAVLLSVTATKAQDVKNVFNPEQYGVTSLAIAPDARGGSMGDIGAATEADIYAQYWNPAKYPFNVARAGVGISYTPWLRKIVNDINLANITGFYRIGDYSAVSASLRYFSLGEVYLSEMEDMTIKPYELAVDVGYSRMLSQCFSMGVNLRFIYSDIKYDYTSESSAGKAFAADIAMYRLGYFMLGNRECSLGWGINISNIGTKIAFGGSDDAEFIPTNLRLGLNFTVPFNEYNKFSIALDANKLLIPTYPKQEEGEAENDYLDRVQRDYYDISPIAGIFKSFGDAPGGFKEEMQEIRWSVGAEYTYNDRFMLRAGYHHESENKGNRKYFTVGAGFHMSVFTIDAAYCFSTAQTNPLDQTMRFSLGFDLDGMRDLFGKMRRRR
ncbi:MAG: type IX secretion system outer membrane channel protein PorV [Bacteroidaceae bacterium]|nr:type IX secretion system outer membrane channel protein PorV [Bacteroidaceae bacterium]MBR6169553.1 type IX secretion system outer membrane channel protein PorV [Bacteroidaceae bacterium]